MGLTHAEALLQPRHPRGTLTPRGECSAVDQSAGKLPTGWGRQLRKNRGTGAAIYIAIKDKNAVHTKWDKSILQISGSFHSSRFIGSCVIPVPPGYSWPVHQAAHEPPVQNHANTTFN